MGGNCSFSTLGKDMRLMISGSPQCDWDLLMKVPVWPPPILVTSLSPCSCDRADLIRYHKLRDPAKRKRFFHNQRVKCSWNHSSWPGDSILSCFCTHFSLDTSLSPNKCPPLWMTPSLLNWPNDPILTKHSRKGPVSGCSGIMRH